MELKVTVGVGVGIDARTMVSPRIRPTSWEQIEGISIDGMARSSSSSIFGSVPRAFLDTSSSSWADLTLVIR
jgi:hypothetical protein